MRIGGWIVFILGILFGILFISVRISGGDLPPTAYFVVPLLLITGWQLITKGKGIAATPESSTPSAAASAQQSAAPQTPTVDLPLSPAVANAIRAATAKNRRIILIVIAVGVIFFMGIGILIDQTVSTPGPNPVKAFPIFALISLAFAAIVGLVWFIQAERPARRDLRASTYLRTTGPIELVPMMGGNMLRLADRAFLMNGRTARKQLSNLNWGVIDYSTHSHVILGAWDRNGKIIYSAPGYLSESPASQ